MSVSTIIARNSDSTAMSTSMMDLLIALIVLCCVALSLVGSLFLIRRTRRSRAQQLPLYRDNPSKTKKRAPRRLTISANPNSSISVYDEKFSIGSDSEPSSPMTPSSPVPEIRITFPDEQDEAGRRKAGRVVVVRIGETSVGLEPLKDAEQLPAYEKENSQAFTSVDINSIGGLKEKSYMS